MREGCRPILLQQSGQKRGLVAGHMHQNDKRHSAALVNFLEKSLQGLHTCWPRRQGPQLESPQFPVRRELDNLFQGNALPAPLNLDSAYSRPLMPLRFAFDYSRFRYLSIISMSFVLSIGFVRKSSQPASRASRSFHSMAAADRAITGILFAGTCSVSSSLILPVVSRPFSRGITRSIRTSAMDESAARSRTASSPSDAVAVA